MLKAVHLAGNRVSRVSVNELKSARHLAWIDAYNPTQDELLNIQNLFSLDKEDLHDALDPKETPRISEENGYFVIMFRAPKISGKNIKTNSFGIFIKHNIIITIHKHAIESIHHMQESSHLLEHGVIYFIQRLLDRITRNYFEALKTIDEDIEELEETILKHPSPRVEAKFLSMKKTLIYFHQSLIMNREVISSLKKGSIISVNKKDAESFGDLYNDTIQLIDMTNTQKEILASAMDMYLSSISNAMNDVIRKLTVIASFALVPTLIASIYGMNFKFMPEIHTPWGMEYGYIFSLMLMAFSVIVMWYYFKTKKWL